MSDKTVTMRFTRDELWFIWQQLEAASTDNYEGEPEHRRIVDRFGDAFQKAHAARRKMPKECDCECPEPETGVALVSMDCPIHNHTPQGRHD